MDPLRRKVLRRLIGLFDLGVLLAALVTAALFTYRDSGLTLREIMIVRVKLQNVGVLLLLLVGWRVILETFGLYASHRLYVLRREVSEIVHAAAMATILLGMVAVLFRVSSVSLGALGVFWLTSTSILILSRIALRALAEQARKRGRNERHILVIGTGDRALRVADELESDPRLGYVIEGFVDDAGFNGNRVSGRLLGGFDDLPHILSERVIDEIVVCLPLKSLYDQASRAITRAAEQGILVRVVTDLFDSQLARQSPEHIATTAVLTLRMHGLSGSRAAAKRTMDVIGSCVLLVLAVPLWLVIVLCIRLDSPGPAIFRQTRVGLNKRPFTMYKFRSMHQDADAMVKDLVGLNDEAGPAFKIHDDPRTTRVGRMIRRLSLDEIPQLLNVIRGDMSLVGPRPLFEWEFARIDEPWIKRRCSVKPGITGLWQVSGRSDLPFGKRIELDLQYIDTWSLRNDLGILARTLRAVASGQGAV